MIVAIEIKSTEECPIRRFPEMDYCNILLKRCIGLESLDCPMRAIDCTTCQDYNKDYVLSECSLPHLENVVVCYNYKPRKENNNDK